MSSKQDSAFDHAFDFKAGNLLLDGYPMNDSNAFFGTSSTQSRSLLFGESPEVGPSLHYMSPPSLDIPSPQDELYVPSYDTMASQQVPPVAATFATVGIDGPQSQQPWASPALLDELWDAQMPNTHLGLDIANNYPPFAFHPPEDPLPAIDTTVSGPFTGGMLQFLPQPLHPVAIYAGQHYAGPVRSSLPRSNLTFGRHSYAWPGEGSAHRGRAVSNPTPISAGGRGLLVPQKRYKPHTSSDRRRYVEEVQLEDPIPFFVLKPTEEGISLEDALHNRFSRLVNRDDQMFVDRGPSISVRINGTPPWSRQIPTRDFRNPPGPITRAKLAKNVAKSVARFIQEHKDRPMEEDGDPAWKVGPRAIDLRHLILVRLDHVSKGSWQAQLQLMHPLH
ncbi:hypothetical protein EW146_g1712 [Bondarzewia mesenterica]|uniref:Uncharacterized protein n=1 Tax=Bondarzewia mesenterica TaxID=1095465 RepID=A0A4V3XFZ4_9AGAM|nr:hypothetical protein EW146_g1712 [Bondarzewia mesenterica]